MKIRTNSHFHNLFRKNIFYVMKNVIASYFMIDTFGELFFKYIIWKTNFFKLISTNVFEADLLGPKTLHENGTVYKNGASQGTIGQTFTTNDKLAIAVDIDNTTAYFYKNNSTLIRVEINKIL